MMKKIKKLTHDNRGMTLVTVIVAIGFVATLVGILLMTTLVNFKMKAVNTRGKDTFYSAEQVVDEITIGLQRRVSDSLSDAYVQVLENYGNYDNDTKKALVETKYYENLWGYLEVAGSGHQKYSVDTLEDFLKPTTKWTDTDTNGNGYGAILTAISADGTEGKEGDMITYTETGIVLKNIKIYYKDIQGFVSVIQTDIRLSYPGFDFATSSMISDITEYSFIADAGVEKLNGGTFDIDGNIYANNFVTKGAAVTITDKKLFVSKYDVDIKSGSLTTGEDVTLWAKNLKVDSSNVNIDGSVNLANDLNVLGKDSEVKLAGDFNGYGTSRTDSTASSAILVNGSNATLDFSGLANMTIAGHAYLGFGDVAKSENSGLWKADIIGTDEEKAAAAKLAYKSLYTGESVGVKSDQLYYLVPAEAIGVDENTGRSLYNKNPLTKAEYDQIKTLVQAAEANPNADQYVYVSDQVDIAALGSSLQTYIKYNSANNRPEFYYHEVRVSDPGVNSLVYFYMMFENEDEANAYFNTYYNKNEASMKKYTKKYLKSIKFPTGAMATFVNASNILIDDPSDEVDGIRMAPANQSNASVVLEDKDFSNTQTFKAYCTKLIPNYTELNDLKKMCKFERTIEDEEKPSVAETNQCVFENIVNTEDKIQEFIDRATDGTYDGVTVTKSAGSDTLTFEGAEGKAIVTTDPNLTVSDEDVHLIVSAGNVKISFSNYEGTIVCDGKLEFAGSVNKATSSPEIVRAALMYGYEDSNLMYTIASVFEGGNDFIYSTNDPSSLSDTSLTGLVTYENWKKE